MLQEEGYRTPFLNITSATWAVYAGTGDKYDPLTDCASGATWYFLSVSSLKECFKTPNGIGRARSNWKGLFRPLPLHGIGRARSNWKGLFRPLPLHGIDRARKSSKSFLDLSPHKAFVEPEKVARGCLDPSLYFSFYV